MKSRHAVATIAVCCFELAFAPQNHAQTKNSSPAAKSIQRVTSVEGISEYRLDNGLKVLLFPDPSKQTVTVNVTYLVGSRNENYGESGMAHLLEHLLFKGTPRHPDIPKELSNHGSRPNGSTWYDRKLFRDLFRYRREPTLGSRSGIRPHGEFIHREERSG